MIGVVPLLIGLTVGGTGGIFVGAACVLLAKANEDAEAWIEEADDDEPEVIHGRWCMARLHADYECDCETGQ